MMPRRMTGLLTMIVGVVICSGCTTIQDFKNANEKVLILPEIKAVLNNPKGDDGQQKVLILSYQIGPGKETLGPDYSKRYIALPLTDNLAPEPLNFRGPLRKEYKYSLEKNIPIGQQKRLLDYRFPPEFMQLGEQLKKGGAFDSKGYDKQLNNEQCGIYSGFSELISFMSISDEDENSSFEMIPYWTSEPFLNKPDIGESQYGYFRNYSILTLFESPAKLAPPYNYLIVPFEIPRPESDRRAALMWACLKLPLNLGIDCVTIPVALIVYPFWPKY